MCDQHDPTYTQREDDPARHVAVDDDLLDVRLSPDTGEEAKEAVMPTSKPPLEELRQQ